MSFMDAPRVDVLYGCPRAFGKIYMTHMKYKRVQVRVVLYLRPNSSVSKDVVSHPDVPGSIPGSGRSISKIRSTLFIN